MKQKLFKCPVSLGKKYTTVKLPPQIARFLKLKKNSSVYWNLVGDGVQISARKKDTYLPFLGISREEFESQEN